MLELNNHTYNNNKGENNITGIIIDVTFINRNKIAQNSN